jgi:hypothetical protein
MGGLEILEANMIQIHLTLICYEVKEAVREIRSKGLPHAEMVLTQFSFCVSFWYLAFYSKVLVHSNEPKLGCVRKIQN